MKRKWLTTAYIALFAILAGCSSTPTIVKEPVYQEIDCGPILKPDPIKMKLVYPTNVGEEGWLLSHQDYKNLSDNFDSIARWMKQANSVIQHYEECIQRYNQK